MLSSFAFKYFLDKKHESDEQRLSEWVQSNRVVLSEKNSSIHSFQIEFNEREWNDLKRKLDHTRYFKIIDKNLVKRNQYGFDPEYAEELVNYWKTQFDWPKRLILV